MLAAGVFGGGLLIIALGHVGGLVGDARIGDARVGERGEYMPGRIVTRIVDGQCLVEGSTIGPSGSRSRLTFLLDSGADGLFFTVASHARALGIDPEQLRFDHSFSNWIGTVRGGTVRLRELRIGNWSLRNVEAFIDESGMRQALLGLPFLNLLNYRVVGNTCELSW
jgi:clan AA aspartic protease (TIGR02281 family)